MDANLRLTRMPWGENHKRDPGILLLRKPPLNDYHSGSPLSRLTADIELKNKLRRAKMQNPLDSLWGTVIAGFVLTLVLFLVVTKVIGV